MLLKKSIYLVKLKKNGKKSTTAKKKLYICGCISFHLKFKE